MKRKLRIRVSKMTLASSFILLSGLCGFAAVALSAEAETLSSSSENQNLIQTTPDQEIANGQAIQLPGGVSITPIPGWIVERKAMGMTLVMKERLASDTRGNVDYSKPLFAKNISVLTLPQPQFIDAQSIDEVKSKISKMIAKDHSLKDFTFTDAKLFDYKSKNDGIVLFSQLNLNNYPMMQMQVIVSGAEKSYLLTYSDLAANFAEPAAFDSAWKSMTSIKVAGTPPKRYEREVLIGGTLAGTLLVIILPFFLIRWHSSRKLRKLADELQYDWDHGALKTNADYQLSDIHSLEATRPINKIIKNRKTVGSEIESAFDSSQGIVSNKKSISFESSVDSFSTRHSRFA